MWSWSYSSDNGDLVDVVVPFMGESITDGTLAKFLKKPGDHVNTDEPIAQVETDKAAFEPAPSEKKVDKQIPKAETLPKETPKEKPKAPSPPQSKPSAMEPQLLPKQREIRVPMTRLRKHVATRLKNSQNTFAMLTTFNEVDMTNVMKLRSDYTDAFVEKHGVKLGLMLNFVKPIINAVIDGDDIIYRDYIDINIAVGTPEVCC
ncbi:hypothetical protein F0562_013680 [Nyssa sinensis]|uniref:Dihydrolipoamide acetyltransferase component of pyruvate dehydrogenase complex n=1 Tax=Nyssa sinensis TaxID=561372 RepID=A0A5J4ZLH0_9ASTE|nr:hypothetical protein F0562_013680 [Nyssa sinensis]